MCSKLLHIFRNTPLGRETLFQSIYFCKQLDILPVVYIPRFTKFLMYFKNDVVQIDLDDSYLTSADTAIERITAMMEQEEIQPRFIEPKNFTASTLPDLPTNFDFMCCPRSMSDLSSKIGLGHIGAKVRWIIKYAHFPILLTSPVFKKWKSIAVFFGGSTNGLKALRLGFRLSRISGMPLDIFTQLEDNTQQGYKQIIKDEDLEDSLNQNIRKWHFFKSGKFEDNLYHVPHDALVVLGAYGYGLIKEMLFGGKMEKIQATISNNLLIAGPKYFVSK